MKCENCGKEHDGSYGSGRFCSDHCKRVWSSKHSASGKEHKCIYCGLIFETGPKLGNHLLHCKKNPKYRLNLETIIKLGKSKLGSHLSEEQKKKTSESCKRFYKEHPELVPYKLHHSSKESYPEKYFRELLINENITGWK